MLLSKVHSVSKLISSKGSFRTKRIALSPKPQIKHLHLSTWRKCVLSTLPTRNIFSKFKNAFASKPLEPEYTSIMKEPKPYKEKEVYDHHGKKYYDNYRYLRHLISEDPNDKLSNHARTYLMQEDSYANAVLAEMQSTIASYEQELEVRNEKMNLEEGQYFGNYLYYIRTVDEYTLFCRKKDGGEEEIIVDMKKEVEKHGYMHIVVMKASKDQKYIGIIVDTKGKEQYDLEIREVASGNTITKIANVVNFDWDHQSDKVYYTQADQYYRPYKVMLRYLDKEGHEDVEVRVETDERFYIDVSRSKDWKYIFLTSSSKETTDLSIILDHVKVKSIHCRDAMKQFFVEHINEHFYILTEDVGKNCMKVMKSTPENIGNIGKWELLISGVHPNDADFYKDHIVLYESGSGVTKVRVLELNTLEIYEIPLPLDICEVQPGSNLDEESGTIHFSLSSPLNQCIRCEYNLITKELTTKDLSITSDKYPFNPDNHKLYRVNVNNEGVEVPMTIMHSKSLKMNGANPTLVSVYGAYGTPMSPSYNPMYISLIERGWVVAFAHVRGGGDLGPEWHRGGKQLNKKNSFSDFISCSNYLLTQGYTDKKMMAATTASAGGIVLGYVANNFPDLYKALIMKVPFVDVLNAMMDKSLPLTVHEFDEWGNPENPKDYENIHSYDPYTNINKHDYPAIYIKGAIGDIRCPIWQQARYTAKLRELRTNKEMLMLSIEHFFGHTGGTDAERMKDMATEIAFLYKALDIVDKKSK